MSTAHRHLTYLSACALVMLCATAAGGERAATPPSELRPSFQRDRLSLYAHDVPIVDMLRTVADVAQPKIAFRTLPRHKVSVALDSEPLRQALGAMLREQSFVLQRDARRDARCRRGYTLWLLPQASRVDALTDSTVDDMA